MPTISRYVRAFWGALRMTLRGEKITPRSKESPLTLWNHEYARRIKAVLQAADQEGLDSSVRKTIKVRLDGRSMNVETALTTLQFHALQEYPSLLGRGMNQQALNTLYATNMNDHYWVITILALPEFEKPALTHTLNALETHLNNVPKIDPSGP